MPTIEEAERNAADLMRYVKIAIIKSCPAALFEIESHVTDRHMNKSDAFLRRRVHNIIRRGGQPPERMASTFVADDYFAVAIAVLRELLSNSDTLNLIARYCISDSYNGAYAIKMSMPPEISGHGYIYCDGRYQRVECNNIRIVFRCTREFHILLEQNPPAVTGNNIFLEIVTLYPIR